MALRSGFEARVQLDVTLYAVKRWSIDPETTALDVSNSEGIPGDTSGAIAAAPGVGFASHIRSNKKVRVMLQSATFDDSNNPFAAPLALDVGMYITVAIFPWGLGGDSHSARILIDKIKHEGEVDGAQPVTIEGVSDGRYRLADS
jgi:hypothetical protein